MKNSIITVNSGMKLETIQEHHSIHIHSTIMASAFFFFLFLAASTAAKTINPTTEAAVGQQNLWQYGPYYQGDIRFAEESQLMEAKSGIIHKRYHWPNGVVPIEFDPSFTDSERNTVWRALWPIMLKTCIKFVDRPKSIKDYVYVTKDEPGCWSLCGRQGGQQKLNLEASGCLREETAAHEFIHALGFYHEQSRPDRDQYVHVLLENVQPEHLPNFEKYEKDFVSSFGVPYDYGSIMHYEDHAFSKNGEPTIVPLWPGVSGINLGKTKTLSDGDAKKINNMYGCRM